MAGPARAMPAPTPPRPGAVRPDLLAETRTYLQNRDELYCFGFWAFAAKASASALLTTPSPSRSASGCSLRNSLPLASASSYEILELFEAQMAVLIDVRSRKRVRRKREVLDISLDMDDQFGRRVDLVALGGRRGVACPGKDAPEGKDRNHGPGQPGRECSSSCENHFESFLH